MASDTVRLVGDDVSDRTSRRTRPVVDPTPSVEQENQLQELLVDFITSLDGFASARGWPRLVGLEGPEYLGWLDERPNTTRRC